MPIDIIPIDTEGDIQRPPIIKIQCWWRCIIAKNLSGIIKEEEDTFWLNYWRERNFIDAPPYILNLLSELPTPRS